MQEPIKAFDTGVVSFSLFDDFWHEQHHLIRKLHFLKEAAWGTDSLFEAVEQMDPLIDKSQKKMEKFWKKAKSEKHAAGGNDVTTINRLPQ